jgi:hypothetical protein
MRGGRKEFYEVGDPILYRALSSFDRPDPSWIVRWLGVLGFNRSMQQIG